MARYPIAAQRKIKHNVVFFKPETTRAIARVTFVYLDCYLIGHWYPPCRKSGFTGAIIQNLHRPAGPFKPELCCYFFLHITSQTISTGPRSIWSMMRWFPQAMMCGHQTTAQGTQVSRRIIGNRVNSTLSSLVRIVATVNIANRFSFTTPRFVKRLAQS